LKVHAVPRFNCAAPARGEIRKTHHVIYLRDPERVFGDFSLFVFSLFSWKKDSKMTTQKKSKSYAVLEPAGQFQEHTFDLRELGSHVIHFEGFIELKF
jgi:hypothetical protein